ncbi:MAG: TIGR03668 family PPOX class F420-dependent oxidoreductase [Halobacteriaceae archaeon]
MTPAERAYLDATRVGRLATADAEGRPHVVPVCFALVGDPPAVVSALDEKPKDATPRELRRVRDVAANPRVALVADHYTEDWDRLGWVQVRGTADLLDPGAGDHAGAVGALRGKYDQYRDHALGERPVLQIDPGHTVSWGDLDPELAE